MSTCSPPLSPRLCTLDRIHVRPSRSWCLFEATIALGRRVLWCGSPSPFTAQGRHSESRRRLRVMIATNLVFASLGLGVLVQLMLVWSTRFVVEECHGSLFDGSKLCASMTILPVGLMMVPMTLLLVPAVSWTAQNWTDVRQINLWLAAGTMRAPNGMVSAAMAAPAMAAQASVQSNAAVVHWRFIKRSIKRDTTADALTRHGRPLGTGLMFDMGDATVVAHLSGRSPSLAMLEQLLNWHRQQRGSWRAWRRWLVRLHREPCNHALWPMVRWRRLHEALGGAVCGQRPDGSRCRTSNGSAPWLNGRPASAGWQVRLSDAQQLEVRVPHITSVLTLHTTAPL